MCVKTIVLIKPIRAARGAASSDEAAASRLAAKKMTPSTTGSTPYWRWNQYAMRLCGMNPPPKASIENRSDSLRTTPLERPRPNRRRIPSVAATDGGASMAPVSRSKPMAMTIPIRA